MRWWHELRRTSHATRLCLCALFALYNSFAVIRALPVNSTLPENRAADRGVYNRNVYRVFRLAQEQAAKPFFEVKNHALFFDRNPGVFMFIAELFVRAGATTPLPNQLLSIALWNCGLLLLFLWLLALFRSELSATAAVGYMVFTPFVLFYSSSIHHEPWCFFFFNLTLYFYVSYLQRGKKRDLLATCLAYFLLCQSYWFYYMSAGILCVALQWHERRFSLRDTLLLAAVPVLAMLTTFLQAAYALGSFDAALFRMHDIAAARTLDMRIEHSQWYPDKRFIQPKHWRRYPGIMRDRTEDLSGTSLLDFAAMLFASAVLAGREASRRLGFMLLVLLAAASWYAVMIQHTVIHRFAGMYGWFGWALIVAVFARELQLSVKPQQLSRFVIALAIPLAFFTLRREYVPCLQRYLNNARPGEPQPIICVKRAPQPESPPAADSLNDDDMQRE